MVVGMNTLMSPVSSCNQLATLRLLMLSLNKCESLLLMLTTIRICAPTSFSLKPNRLQQLTSTYLTERMSRFPNDGVRIRAAMCFLVTHRCIDLVGTSLNLETNVTFAALSYVDR